MAISGGEPRAISRELGEHCWYECKRLAGDVQPCIVRKQHIQRALPRLRGGEEQQIPFRRYQFRQDQCSHGLIEGCVVRPSRSEEELTHRSDQGRRGALRIVYKNSADVIAFEYGVCKELAVSHPLEEGAGFLVGCCLEFVDHDVLHIK